MADKGGSSMTGGTVDVPVWPGCWMSGVCVGGTQELSKTTIVAMHDRISLDIRVNPFSGVSFLRDFSVKNNECKVFLGKFIFGVKLMCREVL